ncbi:MAG TPA: hypothetical protein VMZ06_06770 [Candidatus Bathyarchaeia archaeon]|nr:hypothetical protein [Candidatus Bathyarchaeia archaeon]
MKTAYELAMERLEKTSGPTRKLTGEQKAQIAEIEKLYEAKTAELRLAFEARMQTAQSREEWDAMQAELAGKIASLEEQRENEKEKVWNA